MKFVNRLEIKLDKFEKCHMVSDHDCPLGELYDYACAFKAFVCQKINESVNSSQSSNGPDISPEVEKAE